MNYPAMMPSLPSNPAPATMRASQAMPQGTVATNPQPASAPSPSYQQRWHPNELQEMERFSLNNPRIQYGAMVGGFTAPQASPQQQPAPSPLSAPTQMLGQPMQQQFPSIGQPQTQQAQPFFGFSPNTTGYMGASSPYIMSDMRNKTDIVPLDSQNVDAQRAQAAEFARGQELIAANKALRPYLYMYRPGAPGFVPGPQVGIMAQDAEKHPLTASMVKETPGGKAIDVGKAASFSLATGADHARRLEDLENTIKQFRESVEKPKGR